MKGNLRRLRNALIAIGVATALAVFFTAGASADGTGSISCSLVGGGTLSFAQSGDYVLQPNETVSCTITGATAPAGGGSTTTVFVKHSGTPTTSVNYPMSGGNELVPATYANGVVSFTYSTSGLSSCDTAALSYNDTSNAVNNSKGANSTFDFNAFCNGSSTPPPAASAPTASGSAGDSFTRTYAWSVAKSANVSRQNIPAGSSATFQYTVAVSHDAGTDSGWAASGTITAANSNGAAVSGVTASLGDAACSVSGGSQSIAANGSATWSYSCSWSSAPSSSLSYSVAWGDQTLSNGSPLAAGSAGGSQSLDWNDPTNVVNGTVDVTDSRAGDLGPVSVGGANPTNLTYSQSFAGQPGTCSDYGNTATLSTGESSSATVTVCDGVDLTASATAGDTTYTRTYGWNVNKNVNGSSLVEKSGGGTGTFSYTVTVTHDAGTDSAWQATGTINVANPNDWETVTANVSEIVDNGGTCTVSDGGSVSLAPGASATLSYVCNYASTPTSPTGTATTTISWDAAGYATPDGGVSASAPVAFGGPTTVVNPSTTVNDSLEGALGSLTFSSPSPTSYTYALSFPVPSSNCAKHPNVASLSVGGSANASVELCGPANTGALSQGYWSNKNGTAIITGAASTGGVCNITGWLRGFAPFADLSPTASCSAVSTYVQGVFNAANAKGAAMNAMLKSQMLAVSLDVYFSDASLGGNRIGAPAPIGSSWNVDLSKLVSGENVSAAFGGATRLTVLQALTYAASQSNAGGSAWYGQIKTTQGLAKDLFDAICNGQVYAP